MPRNTGGEAEREFDAIWARCGKAAAVHRFADASLLRGLNKRLMTAPKQPADRLVVSRHPKDHGFFFAEIKSLARDERFNLSLLRPGQIAAALNFCEAAPRFLEPPYRIYVKSYAHEAWFVVRFPVLKRLIDGPEKSVAFSDLPVWGLACAT